ncbi:MAG: DPP IV N-terminal domain-containing protein, partial [Pseudomonadota bacterium]|nr:DPP IV N-terminal domain-containing protein [Pseudomonadota bacterium]
MKKMSLSCIAVFCCAIISINLDARTITAEDLFAFQWIGDPQLSEDGKQAAFVGVTVDAKRSDYETALWRVDTRNGNMQKLTSGKHDSAPRWSPDGNYVAFLRADVKDGKSLPAQLFVQPVKGGTAWQLTDLPKGVSQPAWSKEGKSLAFLSTTNGQDLAIAACTAKKNSDKALCRPEHVSDVHVVTRAKYRTDSEGYLDFAHPSHVWAVAFSAQSHAIAKPRQLTRGNYSETGIVWAPDNSRIYFVSDRDFEPYYHLPKFAIYSVPASGGDTTKILQFSGILGALYSGMASTLSVSPRGDRLAFLGVTSEAPLKSYRKANLWVVELKHGGKKNLTANYDWGIGEMVISDSFPPRAIGESRPIWSADGKSITVVVVKQGRANLERFDAATGAVKTVTSGDQAVTQFASNGRDVVARISTPTHLNDLYF